ncbi:MAG TPA: hypothetical protein ENF29_02815 [Candidatus Acetothermia bacterium]|nr:hypothetical protein [Candidatus Bipolaricaulota bacterium]RLE41321.1 MAG: hypothetical protein DRJ23_00115 [Candidatus Acetothermia bacterium]HDJ29966.1 hypothetical protein [Candidatus Acetothermia bacterium]
MKLEDLLSLIGNAVDRLQRSVTLFSDSDRSAGLKELQHVVNEIDQYIAKIDQDPLLKIAGIDRDQIVSELEGVKHELTLVIDELTAASTG